VHYDDHASGLATREHAYSRGTAIYEAVVATRVIRMPPIRAAQPRHQSHEREPSRRRGKYGQTRDIKNLFVSDGSQFITGAACNPTLAIVTLAIRQTGYIAHQMSQKSI